MRKDWSYPLSISHVMQVRILVYEITPSVLQLHLLLIFISQQPITWSIYALIYKELHLSQRVNINFICKVKKSTASYVHPTSCQLSGQETIIYLISLLQILMPLMS